MFAQFLPEIHAAHRRRDQHHDRRRARHERRGAHAARARTFKPELCSLNMGSMNFGLFGAVDRIKEFKHDWEPHVPRGDAATSSSATRSRTSSTIVEPARRERARASSSSATTSATSTTLAHFLERGIVEAAAVRADDLRHPRRHRAETSRTCCTCGAPPTACSATTTSWSILGAGRHQTNLVTMGAIMGGNVRVGLEDSHLPGARASSRRVERRAGGEDRAHPRASCRSRSRRRTRRAGCWR